MNPTLISCKILIKNAKRRKHEQMRENFMYSIQTGRNKLKITVRNRNNKKRKSQVINLDSNRYFSSYTKINRHAQASPDNINQQ